MAVPMCVDCRCQQRKKILELTGEPYICCGNGLCGFFKTEKNPKDAEMDMSAVKRGVTEIIILRFAS